MILYILNSIAWTALGFSLGLFVRPTVWKGSTEPESLKEQTPRDVEELLKRLRGDDR